jgi:hypothetical protein
MADCVFAIANRKMDANETTETPLKGQNASLNSDYPSHL